jgi:hypothetical protein
MLPHILILVVVVFWRSWLLAKILGVHVCGCCLMLAYFFPGLISTVFRGYVHTVSATRVWWHMDAWYVFHTVFAVVHMCRILGCTGFCPNITV